MNNKDTGSGGLVLIFLIAAIYFWTQNGNLQKQIKELQAQNVAYQDCITNYQNNEDKFVNAIQSASRDTYNAKTNLDNLSLYAYTNPYLDTTDLSNSISSAQLALGVDTTKTYCDIPAAPDVPTPKP